MPLSANVIEAMAAAGCTVQQIIAAAKASEIADSDKAQDRREADRIRKRRQRERETSAETTVASAVSRVTAVTKRDIPSPPPSPSPDKEISQTLLENNPSPLPPPQPFSLSAGDEFERFWEIYPNKVGKAEARKKFVIALRKIAIEPMLEALRRYAQKTDDRPWLNPATWLHQERWGDQPAQVARASPRRPLTGLAAVTADFIQELENDGYGRSSEAGGDSGDDARFPLLGRPDH